MKKLTVLSLAMMVGFAFSHAGQIEARPQYKSVIDKTEMETDAEKKLQMEVKTAKCNHCHDKKDKKVRTEYGMKLHTALGGGDMKKYKYDKTLWKKGDDGKYSDKAVNMLRKAINDAAKPQDEDS